MKKYQTADKVSIHKLKKGDKIYFPCLPWGLPTSCSVIEQKVKKIIKENDEHMSIDLFDKVFHKNTPFIYGEDLKSYYFFKENANKKMTKMIKEKLKTLKEETIKFENYLKEYNEK